MHILCRVFYSYLRLLERTVRLELAGAEAFTGHNVVGFWHEDSFAMNLVLRRMAGKGRDVSVLVTGDARGEYIQYLLEKSGGRAVRLDYSASPVGVMRELLAALKKGTQSVAIALDGPLGPRHEPKKLVYVLAERSGTRLVGVTISYSHRLALRNRWDHYRIPLPFSKITAEFRDYGLVSARHPVKIRCLEQAGRCSIMTKENV